MLAAKPAVSALAGFVFGLVCVAVGTLIRNQVGAIVAVVAYAFAVDSVVFSAPPSIGRYLPGKASDALAGLLPPTSSPRAGCCPYAAWAFGFLAAATARNDRSDV